MRGWWWWKKLAVAMTGGRCHRRRKMMGRGAEGGCGTEEKPCPISRVSTKSPAREQEAEIFENEAPIGLDYYSQAKKTLCDRSPFDTEDAQVSTVPTLPSGLANILSRHSDSRKRQKKSHPGGSEKVRGPNIWTETEDYFRELTVDDVEQMEKLFSCGSSGSEKCFLIPGLGTVGLDNELKGDLANGFNFVNANVVVKEEIKEEGEQFMEVDSIGKEASVLHKEENDCSSSPEATALSTGLEWLLGSKSKVYLTTERPSKKRKLLGGDAGLEKLLIACPVDGVLSLCHYCGLGDKGDLLNRLIVCSSCNVAVHRRCFGVQDDVADSWSCSWCKLSNSVKSHERPCLLCPKQGGALKPVSKSGTESETGGEFTHLFCCQWIPEVYIHDTRTMEPVMNIEGIKETRRKLVCNICKVKCGACVRCSNGTCRTSFHPICAREAGHRMEIWGKFGCDDVELRAFCLKHSEDQNGTNTQQLEQPSVASSDSHLTKHQTVTPMLNKPHKFKISRKNGDKISVDLETTETDKAGNSLLHEEGLSNTRSKFRYQSECGDAQHAVGTLDRSKNEDASTPDTLNFTMILKKLIDRGKVKVKDVASEIGVSADSLASMLYDNHVVPDLHSKIVTWLRNNAHIGSLQKNLKVRIKSSLVSKDDKESVKDSDSVLVTESDVPVKSVPPRRRTKSNIKILKDNKVICSSEGKIGDGLVMDEAKSEELMTEDVDYPSKESVSVPTEKNFVESDGVHEILATNSPKCEEGHQAQGVSLFGENAVLNSAPEKAACSIVKSEFIPTYYIHPVIRSKILKLQNVVVPNIATYEGSRDREFSSPEASSCPNELFEHLNSSDVISRFNGAKLEQLAKARNIGLLKISPEDEVEGELIFHQHSLLSNLEIAKHRTDDLISEVVKHLVMEIDVISKRKWDAVIVNQYISELKEAKKQGRKERRHKEAQAVLSAATAAAAASSRISSFRKDAIDESAHQESLMKVNTLTGRPGSYSQQIPRAKEMLSKLAVPRVSAEMKSGSVQSVSDFYKENPRTCDICRRSDTLLNPILVCSSCKVAVHLDCYRSVKDSMGPWNCELCEDQLSSRSSGALAVNSRERPYSAAECGLCGSSAGAFRKLADGQWVHAFCAEWVLESTFRRGQATPVEGMEAVVKGSDTCHICHRKQGVCIKCNYGHCQSMFHPLCARSAGLYMNVKSSGSKLQHRAYCEKHSLEQKAKAETQRHGIEELKSLKQIRVELERLRLLCERIIKREKLKRELVLSTQDVLVSKRDTAAISALVRSPFFPPDTSSESATTSLRGNTEDCRSGSEAIQRSDDITVDSTVPGKRRIKFPLSTMDNDQKTDDSSTSHLAVQRPRERVSFAGKQIPHRPPFVAQNLSDGGEKRSKSRKHLEMFEKELVMTSDQASVKNQRLPKGFVYVPVRRLSKNRETISDACCGEPLDPDG